MYEVLTGWPPFKGKDVVDTMAQVRKKEPVRPRTVCPAVDRDLETICLTCLAKDPARRYGSAEAVADDLGRWLRGVPIRARAVGKVERAGKWVKRNPVVAGLTLAVLLALAAGATVSYVKYRDAKVQERIALGNENLANRRTAEAEQAWKAEAERVKERDAALASSRYQLGVANMILAGAAYENRDVRVARERLDNVPAGQQGWEWRYLRRQLESGIFTITGHTGPVRCVAYSPDGIRIVTGSDDRTARVWDARTGSLVRLLKGHTDRVAGVAFSPDGTRVVTASTDGSARVWDARTWAPLAVFKRPTFAVVSAAFGPDGLRVVTGCDDGTARVWDARTETVLQELKGHTGPVRGAAYSPDGALVVTASDDRTAKVWDARTGNRVLDLHGHMGAVLSAAFRLDGARVITASRDYTALVWDARTSGPPLVLGGHRILVAGAAFSPDGLRIATASDDRTARVWDARTGIPLLDLKGHTSGVHCVAFSPDGSRVVTGGEDHRLRVWDVRTGTPVLDLKRHGGV